VMSQVRSFVRDAPHIAQLKLMRGFVRSFFSNLRRFTQIQLLEGFVGPGDNLDLASRRDGCDMTPR